MVTEFPDSWLREQTHEHLCGLLRGIKHLKGYGEYRLRILKAMAVHSLPSYTPLNHAEDSTGDIGTRVHTKPETGLTAPETQTRFQHVMQTPCPKCHADAGQACTMPGGAKVPAGHLIRRKLGKDAHIHALKSISNQEA